MKPKLVFSNNDVRAFACNVAAGFVEAIFANSAGAQSGEDIEHLHDMRVSSRRLREALRLFEVFYPPSKLKKELKKVRQITRILGLPREMDVNVALLRSLQPQTDPLLQAALEYLLEMFESKKEKLRQKMRRGLAKLDLQSLESDWLAFTQKPLTRTAEPSLSALTDLTVFRTYSLEVLTRKSEPIRGFDLFPPSPEVDEELHRLRVNTKRFRYALEIYNPIHSQNFTEAIHLSKQLQDVLGDIHDFGVLINALEEIQTGLLERNRTHLEQSLSEIVGQIRAKQIPLYQKVIPALTALRSELDKQIPAEPGDASSTPLAGEPTQGEANQEGENQLNQVAG